jgi:hypothetical protein
MRVDDLVLVFALVVLVFLALAGAVWLVWVRGGALLLYGAALP